jgi:16S rRNA (cytosine967-C5)-methyltransferase
MTIGMARQLAFQVLLDVVEGQAFTNFALRQAFSRVRMDDRDKGLCTELVYGTVQRERSIDALLKPYLRRPLDALDKRILVLLRMSVYQLAFLDKVPAYAVIHEAVEIAKRILPKASGFINGVLRSYLRDGRSTEERLREATTRAKSWADAQGIQHSYPTWMVSAWERAYGREKTVAIMEACNTRSPLSVRVNQMKSTRDDVLARLQDEFSGDVAPSMVSDAGIRLEKGVDMEQFGPYRDGLVTVQDEGAMLIAPLLLPEQHPVVLDMCAAPGTKTTHIAELQQDGGTIDACDVHAHKLALIQEAANRLGVNSIRVIHKDARLLVNEPGYAGRYDAVLLDAPCSGFGVLRHRPDIRWKRTPEDVKALSDLQYELLLAATKLVRPGGVIVYSTCTIMPEENELVVKRVLESMQKDLTWDDIRPQLPAAVREMVRDPQEGLLLTPEVFGTDGFYMARLKKKMRG